MRRFAIVVTLSLMSPVLHAQELPAPTSFPSKGPSPAPPSSGGPIELRISDEVVGRVHRLFSDDGEQIDACTGNCTLRARRSGSYIVDIGPPSARSERIELHGRSVVDIRDGSSTGRSIGATVGAVGSVVSFVGLVGIVVAGLSAGLADPDCPPSPSCKHGKPIDPVPWALVCAAGTGMSIGGWIAFGVSSTRFDVYDIRVAAGPAGIRISMPF